MAHTPIASPASRPRTGARRWHTPFYFVGAMLMLVLALAGCGGSSSSSSSSATKTGGNLVVGLNSDVVTLDPVKSTALVDREVLLNIYDTLVRIDNNNVVQPDLATKWSYTSPTQLVFTLRSGVQFQDGTPFNAAAVVTNINRILNAPKGSSPRSSEISTVSSVQAIDDTHVQFNLTKPFTPLLAALTDRAGIIVSPKALQSMSESQIANDPVNAGSGPFEFVSWAKGNQLIVQRNPHYWGKSSSGAALPYLDKVTYKPITNETVTYTQLETGTINVAYTISPTDVQSAKTNSSLIYKQVSGLSFYGFELNTAAAPFNDVHARRAVAYSVDRQEILTSVLHNVGVIAQGAIPPSSWAYNGSTTAPYSPNTTTAKSELAQSSSASGLTFTMLVASGSPVNTLEATYIQSELQKSGITMKIQQEPFATILSATAAHNFQAALIGWSGRPDPDGNLYSWFHTGGGNNDMQYSNAQVDHYLEDARTSSDQATRATDYQNAEKQIQADSPYIFINHGVSIEAVTKTVQNFVPAPTTIMDFSQVSLSQ